MVGKTKTVIMTTNIALCADGGENEDCSYDNGYCTIKNEDCNHDAVKCTICRCCGKSKL